MGAGLSVGALADTPADRAPQIDGRVFYVDFVAGSDTASGLDPKQAWRHAPGDARATGEPGAVRLRGGDTVLFRGGVAYHGTIRIPASGSKGAPVTYKGDGWGDGRAILDGAAPVAVTWRKCPSAAACAGNRKWGQLYIGRLSHPVDPLARLWLGETPIWLAQEPNQPDPFWYDALTNYRELSIRTPGIMAAPDRLRGPGLSPPYPGAWDGAYLSMWVRPNAVRVTRVIGYDPATRELRFERLKHKHYEKRNPRYAVLNRMIDVDMRGEYAVSPDGHSVLLYPPGKAEPPAHIDVATAPRAVDLAGRSQLVIEGFEIRRYFGGPKDRFSGGGIVNRGKGGTGLRIANNHIRQLKSMNKASAVDLHNVTDATVADNRIEEIQFGSGIRLYKSRQVTVEGNVIRKVGGSAINFLNVEHGRVRGNLIREVRGHHGNGMSIYLQNKDIVIMDNLVTDSVRPLTFRGSSKPEAGKPDIYVINNAFLADREGHAAASWGRMWRVLFANNLAWGAGDALGLKLNKTDRQMAIVNNIIDGVASTGGERWHFAYNIYTDLSWSQNLKHGWRLGRGETVVMSSSARPFLALLRGPAGVPPPAREWQRPGVELSAYLGDWSLPPAARDPALARTIGPLWERLPRLRN